jgi:hypothetical protein
VFKINELNWTFCQFTNESCVALVHFGGELDHDGNFKELYFVNTLKVYEQETQSHQVLFQEMFKDLETALDYINLKYSHWNFINLLDEKSKKSGGCGSCVAH